MNLRTGLVLDANILAVFGHQVLHLLQTHDDVASFYNPEMCFLEAQEDIPDVAKRRGFDSATALSVLEQVDGIVVPVDKSLKEAMKNWLVSESSVENRM